LKITFYENRNQQATQQQEQQGHRALIYGLYLLLFLQTTFWFVFVRFRPRSYAKPHRGERLEQRKAHPRNVVIIKLRNSLLYVGCASSRVGHWTLLTFPSHV